MRNVNASITTGIAMILGGPALAWGVSTIMKSRAQGHAHSKLARDLLAQDVSIALWAVAIGTVVCFSGVLLLAAGTIGRSRPAPPGKGT